MELDSGNKHETVKLKRQLGLFHGVGIILGLVIGSGIFISPKGVIEGTGSPGLALIVWAICGLVGTTGALTFAELGTTFPQAGEKYAYLEEIYGPFPAFLFLWMYMIFYRPSGNAIKCLTFAQYVLQPFYNDCNPPIAAVSLLAICLACLLTFVNVVRVKWAAHGQTVCVTVTTIILIVISIYGINHVAQGNTEYIEPSASFKDTSSNAGDITLAIYSGMFACTGWNALNFMLEELKNPLRNLPLAIYISMFIMTTIYLAVNFSYFAVLGPQGVIQSNAVAVTFANEVMGMFSWIIPVGVAITTMGSYNSGMLVGSRLTFVGGRRGHLPQILGLVHIEFSSPVTSLIFQTIIVVVLCSVADIYIILKNMVFLLTLFDAFTIIGMLHLRWKKPEMTRPFKVPLAIPVIFLTFYIILIIIPLIYQPKNVAMGLLITLCTGVPYYMCLMLWKSGYKLRKLENINRIALRLTQKLLYCVPQESTSS